MPTISLTTDATNAAVLSAAVGWKDGLGHDASIAEVKAHLARYCRDLAREYLRQQQAAKLTPQAELVTT